MTQEAQKLDQNVRDLRVGVGPVADRVILDNPLWAPLTEAPGRECQALLLAGGTHIEGEERLVFVFCCVPVTAVMLILMFRAGSLS